MQQESALQQGMAPSAGMRANAGLIGQTCSKHRLFVMVEAVCGLTPSSAS